jgi:hypothetical protein
MKTGIEKNGGNNYEKSTASKTLLWRRLNVLKPGRLDSCKVTNNTVAVNMAMTKERLIRSGFSDLATAYQSVHVNY